MKCKRPVAVSWNVEGDDTLQVWAEKQIAMELTAEDLAGTTSGLAL